MKLQYLKHNEINKKKWDDCITHSLNHLPYSYSWYLDIVSPKWNAIVDEDYSAVFPLTHRRKAGINYLYQPFFTQQLGLFSKSKIEETHLNEFLEIATKEFRFAEINLNTENNFSLKKISVKKKTTHHLDLNSSYEKIFSSFNENTRRNIRKAEKQNLRIEMSDDYKWLIKTFRQTVGDKSGLGIRDYKVLEQLFNSCASNNSGEMLFAKNISGKILAGMFLLKSKNILINLFNASTEDGKKSGAMFFLFNEVIRKYSSSEKIFDFEGSEIPEVARFYKGFGSEPVYFPHIRVNHLHWSLKWLKK